MAARAQHEAHARPVDRSLTLFTEHAAFVKDGSTIHCTLEYPIFIIKTLTCPRHGYLTFFNTKSYGFNLYRIVSILLNVFLFLFYLLFDKYLLDSYKNIYERILTKYRFVSFCTMYNAK